LGILVCQPVAADEGPVWFWFAACDGPAMGIEVRLDKAIIYQSVFPICRIDRASPVSQGQQVGRIHFTFKPGRSIVWEGYRDTKDTTKAGHLLEADIWHVYWSRRMSSASALVEKGDGTFDNCDISLVPE
jgi:hypothetical protein